MKSVVKYVYVVLLGIIVLSTGGCGGGSGDEDDYPYEEIPPYHYITPIESDDEKPKSEDVKPIESDDEKPKSEDVKPIESDDEKPKSEDVKPIESDDKPVLTMKDPEFWVNLMTEKEGDELLMSEEAVQKWNQNLVDLGWMLDLQALDEIQMSVLPRFRSVILLGKEFISEEKVIENFEAKRRQIPLNFGVVVRQTDVRLWPTELPAYLNEKMERDVLQVTTLDVNEPVLISEIYEDVDGVAYLYVTSSNTVGWVLDDNVAIFDSREEWAETCFDTKRSFVTITEPRFILEEMDGLFKVVYLIAGLGTRLNVADDGLRLDPDTGCWIDSVVELPVREKDASYSISYGRVYDKVASLGYIPVNQANLVRRAASLIGAKCPNFFERFFKCFGINLPDAVFWNDDMWTEVSTWSAERKAEFLKMAPVGTVIWTSDDRTLMKLGFSDGNLYAVEADASDTVSLAEFTTAKAKATKDDAVTSVYQMEDISSVLMIF